MSGARIGECHGYETILTPQVEGAAKMMVTVVAIKKLEAGDVLLRFRAESAFDEPRRGNYSKGCILDWDLLSCVLYFLIFVAVVVTL